MKRLTGLLVALAALLCGCPAQPPKPVPATFPTTSLLFPEMLYPTDPNGYIPLIPPRTDYGPGMVFKGSVNGRVLTVEKVLCENLYPAIKPTSGTLVLANAKTSSNNSVGLDLSLLEKLIGANTGSLSAKYTGKVSYDVDLKSATADYLVTSSLFDGATPRPVDPSCHAAIEQLKVAGSFANSVFIVYDTVATSGLTYKFDQSSITSASLKVDVAKLVNANPSASHSFDASNNSVNVNEPVHIAIRRPVAVDTWVPTGAVAASGATQAVIAAHSLPASVSTLKLN